jgi:hypothetical protein
LRPQGFSPSRRLAPLATFRAYSIPVPPMGFYPSRPFSPAAAVRPLRRRAPRGSSPAAVAAEAAPPRTLTTTGARLTGPGFSRVTAPNASLGFPASRFTASDSEGRSHAPSSPHALLRIGLTVTGPPAPQGILCQRLDRSLSRSINPHAVFHLVGLLDSLAVPQAWAYGFPSEADPRCHRPLPHLHPAVRPPAGARRDAMIGSVLRIF